MKSLLATALQYARPPAQKAPAPVAQSSAPPRHDKRDPETGRFVE